MLREDTFSGNPPFKAAFVGAPPQGGFARHGRGLRRVRGMRRRSFASEGSRERSEAPEGAARRRAHAHRMPCRLSGRPSKAHSSLRPQNCLRLLGAKLRSRRRRHEAEQARTAGRGRRRRDGCEALEGCIQPQADRAVSGERMTRLTPDGRAVAGGAPPQRHSPHTDIHTSTHHTHVHTPMPYSDAVLGAIFASRFLLSLAGRF